MPDALKAKPEGHDAGFYVTLPGEETAQYGDSPNHLAQHGCHLGVRFLGENVRAFFLVCSQVLEKYS